MAVQRRYDIGRMRQVGYGDRAAQLNAMRGAGGGAMPPQGMLGDPAAAGGMQDPNAVSGFFDNSAGNAALNQGLMAFGSNLLQGAGEGRSFGNAIGQAGIQGAMSGFGAYQGEQGRQQGLEQQHAQQQAQLEQIGMLAEQQGLSPEQQSMLAAMPPEEAMGILSEQAFAAGPDPIAQARLELDQQKFAASQQAQQPGPGEHLIEVQGGLWDPVQQQWALAPQDEAQGDPTAGLMKVGDQIYNANAGEWITPPEDQVKGTKPTTKQQDAEYLISQGVDATQARASVFGTPDPAEQQKVAAEEQQKKDLAVTAARTVVDDIGRAREALKGPLGGHGVAGMGSLLSGIPATPAANLNAHIESVKGNVGIDSLLKIKQSGAGLGAIPQSQLEMLASLLGGLSTKMSPSELDYNLQRVGDIYSGIIEANGGSLFDQPDKMTPDQYNALPEAQQAQLVESMTPQQAAELLKRLEG